MTVRAYTEPVYLNKYVVAFHGTNLKTNEGWTEIHPNLPEWAVHDILEHEQSHEGEKSILTELYHDFLCLINPRIQVALAWMMLRYPLASLSLFLPINYSEKMKGWVIKPLYCLIWAILLVITAMRYLK